MIGFDLIMVFFSGCLITISGAFLERLIFAKKYFRLYEPQDQYLSLDELPSVSVCIPARNEHAVIEDCLKRVLASDYPKMEVIVLDDDSVDNTSEAIKAFATAGVRFIKGDKLPHGWIGKNYALKQLTDQAVGSYIIFLGVDTKLQPKDISTMIRYALANKLSMISVMPRRSCICPNVLFGSLRFFWELILHSRNFPAISTSVWLVKAEALANYGNFWQNHRLTIRPESSLASFFYDQHKYRFLTANRFLNITHEKSWHNQVATSIRTSGPVFDKSIWLKAIIVLILFTIIFGTGIIITGFWLSKYFWAKVIGAVALIGISLTHAFYTNINWLKGWGLGFLTWPWTFSQELVLLLISLTYGNSKHLSWKGRHLPPQDY